MLAKMSHKLYFHCIEFADFLFFILIVSDVFLMVVTPWCWFYVYIFAGTQNKLPRELCGCRSIQYSMCLGSRILQKSESIFNDNIVLLNFFQNTDRLNGTAVHKRSIS